MNRLAVYCHIVCLLFGATTAFADPSGCAEDDGAVRVATYNLLNKNVGHAVNFDLWPVRSQAVADLVHGERIDILATQEVVDEMLVTLVPALSEFEKESLARSSDPVVGEHAAIFFKRDRFDKVSGGTFWLSETPQIPASKSWDASMTRICTWVELADRKTGRKLWVFNVHYDHAGKMAKLQSSKLISEVVANFVSNPNDSVLLLGDFNSDKASPEMLLLNANGFADTREISMNLPEGERGSFGNGKIIDHVLIKPGPKVCRHRILNPLSPAGKPLSDHRPVVVDLVEAK